MGIQTYGDSGTETMKARSHEKPGAWKKTEQRAGIKLRNRDCGAGKCNLYTEKPHVQSKIRALSDQGGREKGHWDNQVCAAFFLLALVTQRWGVLGAGVLFGRVQALSQRTENPLAFENSWTMWDDSQSLHFRRQMSTNCGRESTCVMAGPVQTAAKEWILPTE